MTAGLPKKRMTAAKRTSILRSHVKGAYFFHYGEGTISKGGGLYEKETAYLSRCIIVPRSVFRRCICLQRVFVSAGITGSAAEVTKQKEARDIPGLLLLLLLPPFLVAAG